VLTVFATILVERALDVITLFFMFAAAVYFGGKTRIIDFALSNAVNSGIRKMAIATQYKAHSLIRHCQRGWNFFRAERNEYLDILPASQRMDEVNWYRGTADAVAQNIDIIDSYGIQYAIILAGDHIYKMDYEVMLRQHVGSGADVTIVCLTVPRKEASAFGVMHCDKTMRITDFLEKPKDPPAIPGDPGHAMASMGIYVFDWAFLRDLLLKDMNDDDSTHDFGFDLIPYIVKHGKAVAHRFADSCVMSGLETEPYWRDVGTIDAFWQANIDLTDFVPKLDLYDVAWPIWTYAELVPPAKFIHDEDGRRGSAISIRLPPASVSRSARRSWTATSRRRGVPSGSRCAWCSRRWKRSVLTTTRS